MDQPFHRRYVVSQAVQIMETAVVNNNTALATFREMDAAEVSTNLESSVQHSVDRRTIRLNGDPLGPSLPDSLRIARILLFRCFFLVYIW